jgi:hypothetical protein
MNSFTDRPTCPYERGPRAPSVRTLSPVGHIYFVFDDRGVSIGLRGGRLSSYALLINRITFFRGVVDKDPLRPNERGQEMCRAESRISPYFAPRGESGSPLGFSSWAIFHRGMGNIAQ